MAKMTRQLDVILRRQNMRRVNLNIGDRITFKAATRDSYKKMTRVVTGFWPDGCPTVRAHGWSDFVVRWNEILEVLPTENARS